MASPLSVALQSASFEELSAAQKKQRIKRQQAIGASKVIMEGKRAQKAEEAKVMAQKKVKAQINKAHREAQQLCLVGQPRKYPRARQEGEEGWRHEEPPQEDG